MCANKISPSEFEHMTSYPVLTEDQKQLNKIKKDLLKSAKKAYGEDTYVRLKEGTRNAIERICRVASERGFFYIKRNDFAERNHISEKTLRNILSTMRNAGLIVTIYQRSRNQNGLSKPVHLFVDHPYFPYWIDKLNLRDLNDNQASDEKCS